MKRSSNIRFVSLVIFCIISILIIHAAAESPNVNPLDSHNIALQSQKGQGNQLNGLVGNPMPVVDSNQPIQGSPNVTSNTASTSFMRGLMHLTPAQM